MNVQHVIDWVTGGSLGTWVSNLDVRNIFIGLTLAVKTVQRMNLPMPLDILLPFLPPFEACAKPVSVPPNKDCVTVRNLRAQADAASKKAYAEWAVLDMLSFGLLMCVVLWALLVYARVRKVAKLSVAGLATYALSASAQCLVYVASTRAWGPVWTPESEQTFHFTVLLLASLVRLVVGFRYLGLGTEAVEVIARKQAEIAKKQDEFVRNQQEDHVETQNSVANLQAAVDYLLKIEQNNEQRFRNLESQLEQRHKLRR
jgi:hypothetical protein